MKKREDFKKSIKNSSLNCSLVIMNNSYLSPIKNIITKDKKVSEEKLNLNIPLMTPLKNYNNEPKTLK